MADVFISYSKQQYDETRTLANYLEAAGYTVWWDTSLLPNEAYRETIDEQIERATAVIIIWTPVSTKSLWVTAEAEHALRLGKLFNTTHGCSPEQIPKPFNQLHAVPLEDRAAILSALSASGVAPSGSMERRTVSVGRRSKSKRGRISVAGIGLAIAGTATAASLALFAPNIMLLRDPAANVPKSEYRPTPAPIADARNAEAEARVRDAEAAQKAAEEKLNQMRSEAARQELEKAQKSAEDARRAQAEAEQAQARAERQLREKAAAENTGTAPPPVTGSIGGTDVSCSGRTIWKHNASDMFLEAKGDARAIYYYDPDPALNSTGVRKGTLLFDGHRVGDRYVGTARRFSKNCGTRTYRVQGDVISDRKVVLTGRVSRIDPSNCRRLSDYEDVLEFDFARCE